MSKQIIIFDEEDMQKLAEGRPVYQEATQGLPSLMFVTEEGYQKFLDFWGETDDATHELLHEYAKMNPRKEEK